MKLIASVVLLLGVAAALPMKQRGETPTSAISVFDEQVRNDVLVDGHEIVKRDDCPDPDDVALIGHLCELECECAEADSYVIEVKRLVVGDKLTVT